MSEAINAFISHARGKGLDHATIRQLLLAAGWKEKDIARAIAVEGLDVPVPQPSGGGNARDSLIYLMWFASLYVVVGSVIVLYYAYLDHLFPDPVEMNHDVEGALSGIRYAIAAVFVAFPLFLILSRGLEHVAQQAPEMSKQHVARWLAYLTMFLAAAVIVGDLITLLFFFLDGSLTTRFVLKAMVLLVIALMILAYYYLVPHGISNRRRSTSLRSLLEAMGAAVVIGSVVLGFALAGSPFTARLSRLDDRRVADLRAIHDTIQQMVARYEHDAWVVTRPLPQTLEEVAEFQRTRQAGNALALADPETHDPYVYQVTGKTTYELCAQFNLERNKSHELFWNHPAGKRCFSFNVTSPP